MYETIRGRVTDTAHLTFLRHETADAAGMPWGDGTTSALQTPMAGCSSVGLFTTYKDRRDGAGVEMRDRDLALLGLLCLIP